MTVRILKGDCRDVLRSLPDESVHCCVTSPPYFGLRDYGVAGQIGLESEPDAFVGEMVGVFREVRRVLRDDGTLWINLGDSYAASGRGGNPDDSPHQKQTSNRGSRQFFQSEAVSAGVIGRKWIKPPAGYKQKDLIGVPWMVAFALRDDGWYLREDIIWGKRAPMPEPVRDRCTRSHEYVFHLSKGRHYFHDADAISEEAVSDHPSGNGFKRDAQISKGGRGQDGQWTDVGGKRNARSVWMLGPEPFKGAHFATMPATLAERCIKAGCPAGGTVLDPFGGAGTTGLVADRLGRNAILIELNPDYAEIARKRIDAEMGFFGSVEMLEPISPENSLP
jgi:DNA modification methylase